VPTRTTSSPTTVAENFISQYGKDKFLKLIEMLQRNESGPKIAQEFNVTRQRIHQLKVQLGHERVVFVLNPEIEAVLGLPGSSRKTV